MLASSSLRAPIRAAPRRTVRAAAPTAGALPWRRLGSFLPAAPAAEQQQRVELSQEQQHAQDGVAEQATLGQQLRERAAGMAAVLPLASTSFTSSQGELYYGLAKAVDIYLVILTVRILLSWFRNINWFGEPFNTLRQLTDPFLSMFRGIIPAIGGIDLSPMLAFFGLNLLRGVLMGMAV